MIGEGQFLTCMIFSDSRFQVFIGEIFILTKLPKISLGTTTLNFYRTINQCQFKAHFDETFYYKKTLITNLMAQNISSQNII
jgi:hypothetical protein